jgi:integrase
MATCPSTLAAATFQGSTPWQSFCGFTGAAFFGGDGIAPKSCANLNASRPSNSCVTAKLIDSAQACDSAIPLPQQGRNPVTNSAYAMRAVIPVFGNWNVSEIGRYDVEMFLADGARKYCRNTLRGMRASLSRILSWAVACEWIEKNPCGGVKLPRAGEKVIRTILTAEEINALAATLHEPYSTLVLFLAGTGLRVGEAIAIKWSDFEGDVLHVCRRIYEGKLDTTKTQGGERSLPIPRALLSQMKALGCGEWVFRSREGTPINPGNALKRYVRPAAKKLGIALGGWHDFRHTLNTTLRKHGWSARVRADILGHASLHMTEEVYDHADREDFRVALAEIEGQLLRDVTKLH